MSRIEEALNKAVQTSPGRPMARSKANAPLASELGEALTPIPSEHTLQALTAPHSHTAEEYRKLKEALIKESSREGFNNVVLVTSANPKEGKSFKRGIKRDAATFYDVVSMLGQYNQHIKTVKSGDIPEIVRVNETVSLFRWLRNQYMAGYRDTMPSEEEVERIVEERYRL